MMNTTRGLALNEETVAALERLAARRGITAAALVDELVRSYAPVDPPNHHDEDWPDWMDPDAIDAVQAGLTTVERLHARRETWRQQADAPLTEQQLEERAAWMRIREAAAVELFHRGE